MGVPTYFKWITSVLDFVELLLSEKYPHDGCVEHLYIDYNCGIHPAVKAEPDMPIEKMYDAAIKYLKHIVDFAKPEKSIFIAIDGVAPRAKMEQQRARRYKSVKESKMIREIKKKYGEVTSSNIDFNMISPGTEFMDILSRRIVQYIEEMKRTEWSHLTVILSDSNIPGEGEHKIMNHIRENDSSHIAIYGLDSDLIFLSMLNCGPNTVLVRESNQFANKGEKKARTGAGSASGRGTCEGEFVYFSIDRLKDCIVNIMSPLVSFTELEGMNIYNDYGLKPPVERNSKFFTGTPECNQRMVLDYVFLCFLMGNDFLPNLPSLKIREGGLDAGILAYKIVSWELGTFLVNSDGITVNLSFFRTLLQKLSEIEDEFLMVYSEKRSTRIDKFARKIMYMKPMERELEVYNYVENKYDDQIGLGYEGWRSRYYYYHFNILFRHKAEFARKVTPICYNYLEGMKWTLLYYQGKHNNWSWHYNFQEAPSVSDLLINLDGFGFNEYSFVSDEPVLPFVQLMCILPPESANLLPPEIAKLMTARDSDFHDMYPMRVELSILNKQFLWECHPRLPAIDISRITDIVQKFHDRSSSKEMYDRNRVGDCIRF